MWLPFKDWEGPVGTFDWPIRLDSMDGERSLHLDALVDTGSSCTSAPASLLHELGVVPKMKVEMELADGRTAIYDMGEARATVSGRSAITWVIFGDDDARPLLGAYTLEGLLLTVDPWKLEVVPTPYILGRSSPATAAGGPAAVNEGQRHVHHDQRRRSARADGSELIAAEGVPVAGREVPGNVIGGYRVVPGIHGVVRSQWYSSR